jgi:hypothetical protein
MAEDFTFIDRCALVIRPTWKFVEWLNQLEEEAMSEDPGVFTQTVYLVEEIDRMDATGTAALLEAHFPSIASNEFGSWWTNEADWPPMRHLNDFFQYFECTTSEMVVDLLSEENYDN